MRAIQVLSPGSLVDGMEVSALDNGQQIFHIDLSKTPSKPALIEAIAAAMSFPDYCGSNWDGLEECLRDLPESKGWLLVFDCADALLGLPTADLSVFLSILFDTAEFWKNEGHLFHAVLVGSPSLATTVQDSGSASTRA